MPTYSTVTETVKGLEERGFTENFSIKVDHLSGVNDTIQLYPDDFDVVETYRYEGESDPGDETMICAIRTKEGANGIIVFPYSSYSEEISMELVQKLSEQRGLQGLENRNYRENL